MCSQSFEETCDFFLWKHPIAVCVRTVELTHGHIVDSGLGLREHWSQSRDTPNADVKMKVTKIECPYNRLQVTMISKIWGQRSCGAEYVETLHFNRTRRAIETLQKHNSHRTTETPRGFIHHTALTPFAWGRPIKTLIVRKARKKDWPVHVQHTCPRLEIDGNSRGRSLQRRKL